MTPPDRHVSFEMSRLVPLKPAKVKICHDLGVRFVTPPDRHVFLKIAERRTPIVTFHLKCHDLGGRFVTPPDRHVFGKILHDILALFIASIKRFDELIRGRGFFSKVRYIPQNGAYQSSLEARRKG